MAGGALAAGPTTTDQSCLARGFPGPSGSSVLGARELEGPLDYADNRASRSSPDQDGPLPADASSQLRNCCGRDILSADGVWTARICSPLFPRQCLRPRDPHPCGKPRATAKRFFACRVMYNYAAAFSKSPGERRSPLCRVTARGDPSCCAKMPVVCASII